MYLYLKSTDCLDVFPGNLANHFKIRLPERLQSGSYSKCGLVGLVMPYFTDRSVEEVFVVTNFVCDSIVGGGKMPVLCRHIQSSRLNIVNFSSSVNYMPIRNIDTDVVEIKVLNGRTKRPVNFKSGVLYCTFHFIELV